MAIDFLIFAVLLISFLINFLALAAFWVTPGLRTTANRFTINLLIINLVGCIILAPTLFLSGNGIDGHKNSTGSSESAFSFLSSSASSVLSDDSIEFYSKPGNHQIVIRHNGKVVQQEGIILQYSNVTEFLIATGDGGDEEKAEHTIETIYKCNATYCHEVTIDESGETLVITEIEEKSSDDLLKVVKNHHKKHLYLPQLSMRPWSIDMAAALGAMGVLLVVGDTWCAITDPLRYHSRISGLKSWILIALTWLMGLVFGALSAFREIDFESDTIVNKHKRFIMETATFFSLSSTNNIFSMIFSCLYFVIIILLPFGFVCGMYWRIFSEARGNGLRMRQNGSSPLLQSALNLTHAHQAVTQQYTNSLCMHRNSISSNSSHGGGLQMQIDLPKRTSPACHRRDSAAKVLLPPISDDGQSDENDTLSDGKPSNEQRPQHIILTLQTASGEIKRNYSARQLELLDTTSQDFCDNHHLPGIRQVHSSPNLHRTGTLPQLDEEDIYSPHLLGRHLPQNLPSVHSLGKHTFQQTNVSTRITHPHYHHHQQQQQHHHQQQQQQQHHLHHHQSLQIPTIQASPKAISYMSSLRHRLSNASSLFKYREESRAARISILVVIMFLVSYLPYGFLVLLQSRVPSANFEASSQLAIFMILLANMSSPFIFAYRNKRVRRGVKRFMHLEGVCGEKQMQRQNSNSCRSNNTHKYNANLKQHQNTTEDETEQRQNSLQQQQQQQQQQPGRTRPVLQRGITIIEQVPLHQSKNHNINSSKLPVKDKLYKLFFKSSRKQHSNCTKHLTTTQVTILDADGPTEV
uniref:G-protein coupled receptors family 1 profile domain-containing protein n=1 Tax=Glossina palpalis gambiensis TaxID=67801 RepID=A0A1B0BM47_9MUSC